MSSIFALYSFRRRVHRHRGIRNTIHIPNSVRAAHQRNHPSPRPEAANARTWAYTPTMAITLDPATEQHIQRKIEQGPKVASSREPAEVTARALDPLDEDETWSPKELEELNQHLSASLASADRGELYTGEQARRILTERRAQQPPQA